MKANGKKKSQHVIPIGNGWVVKAEGDSKFTLITDNKKDAVAFAREIAKNNHADLFIHDRDGRIKESNSYAKEAV